MCEQCQQREAEREDSVRWIALLLRRVGILIVSEVERKYDLEPSLRTKRERERQPQRKTA